MDFKLRPFVESDYKALTKHANNKNIAKNMMNRFPHPYSEADGKAFIQMAMQGSPPNLLAIDINEEVSGGIGLHPLMDVYSKNAELGYWLAEPYWGKGIIPKAVMQMTDYGFKNFDIDRIFARPFGHNLASQRVLEKCGFVFEAKFEKTIFKDGEYIDELIYAIRRP